MEVILLDSVPNLGDRGATVKVKPGYARNYLFPRKLALPMSDANRNVFSERERVLEKRDQVAMEGARKAAEKLADVSCTIRVQVGEEDKLYGSVTAADIARSLTEQGHEVDRRQIELAEPIKQLGVYTVDLKLHREVSAPIKVWVVKE
jgi:large subunit ribosomal protein L9